MGYWDRDQMPSWEVHQSYRSVFHDLREQDSGAYLGVEIFS